MVGCSFGRTIKINPLAYNPPHSQDVDDMCASPAAMVSSKNGVQECASGNRQFFALSFTSRNTLHIIHHSFLFCASSLFKVQVTRDCF